MRFVTLLTLFAGPGQSGEVRKVLHDSSGELQIVPGLLVLWDPADWWWIRWDAVLEIPGNSIKTSRIGFSGFLY